MKSDFEPQTFHKTNSIRRLAWPAGLLLLVLSVWTVCGNLLPAAAAESKSSRNPINWLYRCRVEIRQLVSIANYVLTPEDDTYVLPVWLGGGQTELPRLWLERSLPATDTGKIETE